MMTGSENGNLILFLEAIGWKAKQITNFLLVLDGKLPIEEAARKHKEIEGTDE